MLDKDCRLFDRRASKITTTVVSVFTAHYVHLWREFFETPLVLPLPSFDGRAVPYPGVANVRDYLSWRQADCVFGAAPCGGAWVGSCC